MTVEVIGDPGHLVEVVDFADERGYSALRTGPDGRLRVEGAWYPQRDPRGGGDELVDHTAKMGLLGWTVGRTVDHPDGVEIVVTWHHTRWSDYLDQVGPAFALDPTATSGEMGVVHVNDLALPRAGGYSFGAFRPPSHDRIFAVDQYQPQFDGGPGRLHPMGRSRTVITTTVAAGGYTVRWEAYDGAHRTAGGTPVAGAPVPRWARRRDGFGVAVIECQRRIGVASHDRRTMTNDGPPVQEYEPETAVSVEVRVR